MRIAIVTDTLVGLEKTVNAKLGDLEQDGSTVDGISLAAAADNWAVLIRYEPARVTRPQARF